MKKFVISLTAFFLPVVTFAAAGAAPTTNLTALQGLIEDIRDIVQATIPIAVALAVLFFFWGLAQYILASGSDESRAEGRNKMIWGVVALFVIVSIWGIVGFLGGLLGIGQGGKAPVPGVNKAFDDPVVQPKQIQPKNN